MTSMKNLLKRSERLRAAKRRLDQARIRWHMIHLQNHLGIAENLKYALYQRWCRAAYRGKPATNQAVRDLRANLFAVLPANEARRALAAALASVMDGLYPDPANRNPSVMDPSFVQMNDAINAFPNATDILDQEVRSTLEAFFGSNFKIYRACGYRTLPKSEPYQELQNAWRWHSDCYPSQIIKVMMYLTDTDRHSGAFPVHPVANSKRLFRLGFFDRYAVPDALQRELDDAETYVWAEGPAGTIVIFDDNLVHRATPPEPPHHRDVFVFEVMPSREPWDAHLKAHRQDVSSPARLGMKWPANPFRFE